MARLIRIGHRTSFRYDGPAHASYNEVRMTPLTLSTQTTLESRIEVVPAAPTVTYGDYWGTRVTAFDLHEPHDALTVLATSVVETADPPAGRPGGCSWTDLAGDARDRFVEFLTPTRRTTLGPDARAVAAALVAGLAPAEAAGAVAAFIHAEVSYVPGVTGVQTDAAEAWHSRRGVCQDIAHLAVGLLRSVGIPARYVSGYLNPGQQTDPGSSVTGQSHAWVEWWVGHWVGFDPTNARPADADHVLVARGRDYDDVPPLRGIYQGPPGSQLDVEVDITRLA